MGTETEYGISVPGNPGANAMLISSQVVNAYAQPSPARSRRTRWDFEEENPLRDARGFDLSRDVADPTPAHRRGRRPGQRHPHQRRPVLRRPRAPGVLRARSAPTRATPCSGTRRGSGSWPRRAAGPPQVPNTPPINLYKNNTDNKGASYGTHENYLMRRETPFADIVRHLTPFFVSRQVVCRLRPGRHRAGRPRRRLPDLPARRLLRGRGRPGDHAEAADHQHPRRAARRRREVPPAARHHRRREPGRGLDLPQARHDGAGAGDDRGPVPVRRPHRRPAGGDAARGVARPDAARAGDAAVRADADRRPAADGVRRAGAQVRRGPLRLRRRPGHRRRAGPLGVGAQPAGDRPDVAVPRARLGGEAADPRGLPAARRAGLGVARGSRPIDLQYSDVRPDKGLYHRLAATGRFDRIVTDAEVDRAVTEPPEDTRAYFRGRCLAKYPDEVAAASWDSVIFDLPGRDSLQRVPTLEPLRGTKEHVGDLLDRCDTAEQLVAALTGG